MSLTDSEDSDESESSNDCVVVEEVKPKPKPKPVKPHKLTPNVLQYKTQFIPGKAFHSKNVVKSQTFVRKRKNCQIGTTVQQSVESVEDYDSDVTVIDEDYTVDDWRNGPAKRWYDMLGLSPNRQQYDYGFKLKADFEASVSSPSKKQRIDSEDAFNLVSQISWEKDVIWDPDFVRQKVMRTAEKPSIAGWIPIEEKRTAPDFFKQIEDNIFEKLVANDVIPNELIINCNKSSECDNQNKDKDRTALNGISKNLQKRKAKLCDNDSENSPKKAPDVSKVKDLFKWVSTLPQENRDLIQNCWEDDIIWDPNAMSRIPEPKIIPFSSDDDNAIIEWNEFDNNSNDSNQMADGLRQLSLNISNDEFYTSVIKADNSLTHSLLITHSIPAIKLHPLCFPTWDPDFFRTVLKKSRKLLPKVEHNVLFCNKQINCLSSEAPNSKDLSKFLIKNIGELSARNGHLVLMEYSEERPPLFMRVGMGSQLLNYFNKSKDKNYCPEDHRFAQTRAVTTSPFIGQIGTGRNQLALENNMFRSPIWEHTCPETDFLIIKTDDNYYIREVDGLFVVGQTLPLIETPSPKSKNYYDFAKQFAKMFIYRLFEGRNSVRNLDTELEKAFPNLTKHFQILILRKYTKRIKQTDRFELLSKIPFDNQINNLLTPENCCAYYSSAITAATTLKEMGVGDRLYLNNEDNDCDNKLNDLSFAPWNTTVAYIGSLNARKWLNVNDYNEDGSLVFRNQSYKEFKDQMPSIKRCQPLTDRSLKRLNIRRAHEWLIDYGMSRNKVKRYKNIIECRALIKDLSNSLRESGVTAGISKTRTTEQHYKLQCQRVFDLHSRVYSKTDYETDQSDEEEEDEEESDSDLEEWGQDLEAMLLENKSLEQIEFEREEKERKEWLQSVKGKKDPKGGETKTKRSFKGKVLKISRTYEMDGKKFVRDEIVRIPKVIEAYIRIRETKSEDFIKQLSFVKNHTESGQINSKTKSKLKTTISVANPSEAPKTVNGVLKTVSENVSNIRNGFVNSVKDFENIDINDDNWDINDTTVEENESLVRVDGSKLKFSKQVVLDANQIEANEQRRIQEEKEEEERSKRISYFTPRTSTRVRIDPMVKLKDIFDRIIIEVRKREELDENIEWFLEPIRVKDVPDYYDVIKNPIDLKTIRQNITRGKYSSREEFLSDVKLIYENSLEYNGDNEITADAHKLFQFCKEKLDSIADCVAPLEQMYRSLTINGRVP